MTTAQDTAVAAREAQLRAFRRMSPSARMAVACQMSDEVRRITADGHRHRHPELTDAEVQRAVRQLLLHAR